MKKGRKRLNKVGRMEWKIRRSQGIFVVGRNEGVNRKAGKGIKNEYIGRRKQLMAKYWMRLGLVYIQMSMYLKGGVT